MSEKWGIPSVCQTRTRKTGKGKKVFKKPAESPVKPNDVTRKEQEPAKEMTIQRNNANTTTSRLEAPERQEVRKGEAVNLEETQKNRQQEP